MPPETENVRVVVRIRPFLQSEIKETPFQVKQNGIMISTTETQPRFFQYDAIFQQNASQQQVFEASSQEIVNNFMKGMNGCILCYGQTSSGKTYTCGLNERISDGIVYRSLYQVFTQLQNQKYDLQLTFIQIYNETISNLLKPDESNLQIREISKNDFQLSQLYTVKLTNLQQTIDIIQEALKSRKIAPTFLNQNSSRAHTMFQLNLKHFNKNNQSYTVSKLQILDLAGSERVNKSRSVGQRFTEAVNINQSLSMLGKTISALSNNQQFVPVRSSLLTKLLTTTLMKNCKTVLIATLCPSVSASHESLSTLQFAKSCREIAQTVQFNVFGGNGVVEDQIETNNLQVEQLNQEQLEKLELLQIDAKQVYSFGELQEIVQKQKQINVERLQLMQEEQLLKQQLKNEIIINYYKNQVDQMQKLLNLSKQCNCASDIVQFANNGQLESNLKFLSNEGQYAYSILQQNCQKINQLAQLLEFIKSQLDEKKQQFTINQKENQSMGDNLEIYDQIIRFSQNQNLQHTTQLLRSVEQYKPQMQFYIKQDFLTEQNTFYHKLVQVFQQSDFNSKFNTFTQQAISQIEQAKQFVTNGFQQNSALKHQKSQPNINTKNKLTQLVQNQKHAGQVTYQYPSLQQFGNQQQFINFSQNLNKQIQLDFQNYVGLLNFLNNQLNSDQVNVQQAFYSLIIKHCYQLFNFSKVFQQFSEEMAGSGLVVDQANIL